MNELIWVGIVLAGLAFVLSVINSLRISALRNKLDVDLVNHREDVNLSMESVKFTATREVKNLRKEINKRNRPNPPRKKPTTEGAEVKESEVKSEGEGTPKTNQTPNPNRRKYRKPRRKPEETKTTEE